MWNADQCQARADEAEELARMVALDTDRQRLQQEARSWRRQAADISEREQMWRQAEPPSALSTVIGWFRRSSAENPASGLRTEDDHDVI